MKAAQRIVAALSANTAGTANTTVSVICNLENWNKEYDARLRVVQPPVYSSDTYYMFNKRTGAELQELLGTALKALRDDGTLKKLSL